MSVDLLLKRRDPDDPLTANTRRLAERLREIAERPSPDRLLRAELLGIADAVEQLPEAGGEYES